MIQELRLVDNVCMLIQKFPQEQWARIPTPYSIKDKNARLWDTTKCDGSYTWYLHFTYITYWLQCGFESILVSIFDHLIDITFRIVYQQAHCHWSSLFALCFIPIDWSDTLFAKPQMSWPCLDMLQLFMNRQIKAPYYVLMAPPVELRDKYHILPANF